jgi:hypothetical protein
MDVSPQISFNTLKCIVAGSSGTEKTLAKRTWSKGESSEGSHNKSKRMTAMTEEHKVLGKRFREFVEQHDPNGRMGPLEFLNAYPQVNNRN